MTDQLLRFNYGQKFITFDFETANLALGTGLPWQLGYITHQGKKQTGEFERKIFWPDYQIADNIAMLNHFDQHTYESEARDPLEVLEEFEAYLYNPEYIVVSMNGLGFDCFIHNNWRKALGKKTDYSWMNRHLDILPLYRAVHGGAKVADNDDLLCWQYRHLHNRDRKVKASLSAQLKYFSIPFDEANKHDAVYDVKLTFEVFQKIIWQLEI
jgi:DNA polymerase III epsilon subunit-like protein